MATVKKAPSSNIHRNTKFKGPGNFKSQISDFKARPSRGNLKLRISKWDVSQRLTTLSAKSVPKPPAKARRIQSMASGSSNRATDNGQASKVSKPSWSDNVLTTALAAASSPQMNMDAFWGPYFGLAILPAPV